MDIGIKHLHSYTAYLTLAFIIIAIVYAIYCWLKAKPFTKTAKSIALIALIATHIQLLFGLILYFLSPLGFSNFSGEAMKDAISRLYILEHPIMMIIGAILITYGYSKAKRSNNDKAKFSNIAIFYTLGLILILSRIPWNVWL